jgi:hypothetical protein
MQKPAQVAPVSGSSSSSASGGHSSALSGERRIGASLMGGFLYDSLKSYLKRHLEAVKQVHALTGILTK